MKGDGHRQMGQKLMGAEADGDRDEDRGKGVHMEIRMEGSGSRGKWDKGRLGQKEMGTVEDGTRGRWGQKDIRTERHQETNLDLCRAACTHILIGSNPRAGLLETRRDSHGWILTKSFLLFSPASDCAQVLLMTLCMGITPYRACRILWSARD